MGAEENQIGEFNRLLEALRMLKGLEVAALAHKSFQLDTLNVHSSNDPARPECQTEIGLCGYSRAVDVVALPHRLPFPDRVYDYVVCGRVAEIADPISTLHEWMRVARQYVLIGYEHPVEADWPDGLKHLIEAAKMHGFQIHTLLPSLPWEVAGYTLLLERSSQAKPAPKARVSLKSISKHLGYVLLIGGVSILTGWQLLWTLTWWPLWELYKSAAGWYRSRNLNQTYPFPAPMALSVRQEQVGAVVVTYNPGSDLLDNLRTIVPQVDRVLVVDNASTSGLAYLEDARSIPRVTIESNSQNLGIAAALNQGAEWALASGYDWLATFDQDSRLPGGYTEGLLRGLAKYPSPTEVGVVVPLVIYPWSLWPTSTSPSERERQVPQQEVRRVTGGITSGSMVRSSLLTNKRWREDYFIDLVDYEFCLRASLQGYQTVEVGSVALFHQTAVLMTKEIGPSAYTPDRYYYIVRNSLDMIRRYARNYPGLMGHTLYSLAVNHIKPHIRLPLRHRN